MNFQVVSDLHFEFFDLNHRLRQIAVAPDADVLIVAGDIANGVEAIGSFRDWPVPVIYVLGNHEFYRREYGDVRAEFARLSAAQRGAVRVLDPGEIFLNDRDGTPFRILGLTLWSDFRLYEPGILQSLAMIASTDVVTDFRAIKYGTARLTPEDVEAEHIKERRWLEEKLAEPFAGKTVVVSHHAPSELSVHPRFRGDPVSGAFASRLDALAAGVSLWVHGHMHDGSDYRIGDCRVVANPRGYMGRSGRFENPDFREDFVASV